MARTNGDALTTVQGTPSVPTVCIITLCSDLTYLYGTLTTLQTIRTGFPTARVFVLDNGSLIEAQSHIQRAAAVAGASFLQVAPLFSSPLDHCVILRALIMDERFQDILGDPLIILDGDCLFWESCQAWKFEGLLAGRLIPARAITPVSPAPMPPEPTPAPSKETHILLPRLHTSFWWIPDRRSLCERICEIQTTHPTWDPFTPWMVPDPSGSPRWYIGDTGANLCGALQNACTAFTTAQLTCYDHLFGGSSSAIIAQLCAHPIPGYEWFPRVHAAAQRGDWAAIRGVWREQEAYFTGTGQQAHE